MKQHSRQNQLLRCDEPYETGFHRLSDSRSAGALIAVPTLLFTRGIGLLMVSVQIFRR
jgi:hypothetical protein